MCINIRAKTNGGKHVKLTSAKKKKKNGEANSSKISMHLGVWDTSTEFDCALCSKLYYISITVVSIQISRGESRLLSHVTFVNHASKHGEKLPNETFVHSEKKSINPRLRLGKYWPRLNEPETNNC